MATKAAMTLTAGSKADRKSAENTRFLRVNTQFLRSLVHIFGSRVMESKYGFQRKPGVDRKDIKERNNTMPRQREIPKINTVAVVYNGDKKTFDSENDPYTSERGQKP